MILGIFTMIYIMTLALQVFVPYIVRETIVFGVTVPEQNVNHPTLLLLKKRYTQIVGISGLLLLVAMFLVYGTLLSEYTKSILLLGVIFVMLTISMTIYWWNYQKIMRLKKSERWGFNLKQVRAVDLTARSRDEMLPWPFFMVPMCVTIFILVFTIINYNLIPASIAVHWGPSGEPDKWREKTYFTAVSLPLILFMMQWMMWGIADSIKRSSIKLSINHQEESLDEQLKTRKFISWYMVLLSYSMTILFSILQVSSIYPSVAVGKKLLPLFIIFIVIAIGFLLLFVWKKRQWRIKYTNHVVSEVMDVDEDRYWKVGLIYINREDPSIFVEKRFGVGWTMNLANPRGYIVFFLPLMLLILISILSL